MGPGVGGKIDVALGDSIEDLLLSFAPEGRNATQQDVQNDAAAPYVSLLSVLALQHLHRIPYACLLTQAIGNLSYLNISGVTS